MKNRFLPFSFIFCTLFFFTPFWAARKKRSFSVGSLATLENQQKKSQNEVDSFKGTIGFNQTRKIFKNMKDFYREKAVLYCKNLKVLEKKKVFLEEKKKLTSLEQQLQREKNREQRKMIEAKIAERKAILQKIKIEKGLLDVYLYELLCLGEPKKEKDQEITKHFLGLSAHLASAMVKGETLFQTLKEKNIEKLFPAILKSARLTLLLLQLFLASLIIYTLVLLFERCTKLISSTRERRKAPRARAQVELPKTKVTSDEKLQN